MKKIGLFCLTLLVVLAACCLSAGGAEIPSMQEWCSTCQKTQRWDFTGQYRNAESYGLSEHFGIYACSVCGRENMYGHGAATGAHTGGTATCGKKAVCTVCGLEYGTTPPHDLEDYAAQAATCSSVGWEAYQACKNCTYSTKKEIPMLPHDTVRHEAQAATCTEDGNYVYYTCKNCPYTTYKKISAKGHDKVTHDAQAATCTEIGWEAYETCTRCTYTTYAEISALGHDTVPHDAQAATCTEIGWDAYETCTRCPYTTYEEISELGHDWHFEKTVKPTCETDGYTLYACSRCPETYTDSPVKKLGHWFGEWNPNGNEAHTAECRRNNCSHAAAVDCEWYEYTVNGESLTLCPVCGEAENAERLELIEGASAYTADDSLPKDELVARRNAACLSLAFEYAGKVTEFEGEITFTLPAETLNGASLVLVSPDGTETPLSLKEENGTISFTLIFTDMALLRLIFET